MINMDEKSISKDAEKLISLINQNNSKKTAIKGIGFLDIKNKFITGKYKVAFATDSNMKFRLEFLTATGLPGLKISCDGSNLYIWENSKVKKFPSTPENFKKISGHKITTDFISRLMSGKIPLIEFNKAYSQKENILFLSNGKSTQTIKFSDNHQGAYSIELKNNHDILSVLYSDHGNFNIKTNSPSSEFSFKPNFKTPLDPLPDEDIFILTR